MSAGRSACTPASRTISRSAGSCSLLSRPARRLSSSGRTGGGWIRRPVSGVAGLVNRMRRAFSVLNSSTRIADRASSRVAPVSGGEVAGQVVGGDLPQRFIPRGPAGQRGLQDAQVSLDGAGLPRPPSAGPAALQCLGPRRADVGRERRGHGGEPGRQPLLEDGLRVAAGQPLSFPARNSTARSATRLPWPRGTRRISAPSHGGSPSPAARLASTAVTARQA